VRIIGILVLILELASLIITLRAELKKNNITVSKALIIWGATRTKFTKYKNRIFKKPPPEKLMHKYIRLLKWRK